MKFVWNDKVDNTFNGNLELVNDGEEYSLFRIYVDKPCYVTVNNHMQFNVVNSLVLQDTSVPDGWIYSVVLHDKNVNYFYEGTMK